MPFRRPAKPVAGWYVSSTLSEKPAMPKLEYPVIIEPLPQDDGGGFVALVPDLPGCMSDGETAQAALASTRGLTKQKRSAGRFLRRHATSSRRSNPATNCLRCPRRSVYRCGTSGSQPRCKNYLRPRLFPVPINWSHPFGQGLCRRTKVASHRRPAAETRAFDSTS
jgi:hypothetical protein